MIQEDKSGLVLSYSPEEQGSEWVGQALRDSQTVRFERIFKFKSDDLIQTPTEEQDDGGFEYRFRFAKRDGNYHRVPGRILQVKNDVLIETSGIQVSRKLFVAVRSISIFRRMAEVIGGETESLLAAIIPATFPSQTSRSFSGNFRTPRSLIDTLMPACRTSSVNTSTG